VARAAVVTLPRAQPWVRTIGWLPR
jgi:hypothetical protein